MRVDVDASPVEELAWLVKDNLYSKHFVLSAEELFVDFLQPNYGGGARLELEPMLSYQRMLLHRLADCFGLVHESVGEGYHRHIVIERCHESEIPLVLVSDVLESSYGDVHHAPANRQLLHRSNDAGDQSYPTSVQSPSASLEEREAAYQAARERIFSERSSLSPKSSLEQGETQRARPVPVVARRMIAHALGKPQVLTGDFPPTEISASLEDVSLNVPKETPRHSPAKAARRMLTQALGFPVSSPSARGPDRMNKINQDSSVSVEADLSHCDGEADVASLATSVASKKLDIEECLQSRDAAVQNMPSPDCSGASHQSSEVPLIRSLRKDRPATAAERMFAQALGLPQVSQSVPDSPTDGLTLIRHEGQEGSKPRAKPNVLRIAEDGIVEVPQSTGVGSACKASEKRGRREKHTKNSDPNNLEFLFQADLRIGGGRDRQKTT